jgi:hypothetical protein
MGILCEKEPTENIIWTWIPSKEQIEKDRENFGDLADEYRIKKIDDKYPGGIVLYTRYHGNEWIANPWCSRYVIAELLRRLGVITGESCPTHI